MSPDLRVAVLKGVIMKLFESPKVMSLWEIPFGTLVLVYGAKLVKEGHISAMAPKGGPFYIASDSPWFWIVVLFFICMGIYYIIAGIKDLISKQTT